MSEATQTATTTAVIGRSYESPLTASSPNAAPAARRTVETPAASGPAQSPTTCALCPRPGLYRVGQRAYCRAHKAAARKASARNTVQVDREYSHDKEPRREFDRTRGVRVRRAHSIESLVDMLDAEGR